MLHYFSQTDKEQLDYFPLHIGDTWQYSTYYDMQDGNISRGYKTVRIIGDTVMSNNKKYYIFRTPNNIVQNEYWRLDTTNLEVFQYAEVDFCQDQERKMYDININPSVWIDCAFMTLATSIVKSTTPMVVGKLSMQADYISFLGSPGMNIRKRVLSKGFGYSTGVGGELMVWNEELVYAKINGIEYGNYVGIKEKNIPSTFSLSQNYPNPFNPSTTIQYSIPVETGYIPSLHHVSLKVYDMLGREVATLVNEVKTPGTYEVKFDIGHVERSRDIPSGVYFYRLSADPSAGSGQGFSETRKMILLK